ncbi:MAG: type II toxin-antitoxin system VapC family toxin [Planctomycetes bacterium]|nr:type II toxin-antitoxin system VapC family toxin [Planctomycetota bacterium]
MFALDTNILVRFLVKDDDEQSKIVFKRFKKAEKNNEILFIPLLVVLELIWVLDSVYDCGREEIVNAIDKLTMMPIIQFEKLEVIHELIKYGKSTSIELSDLLICNASIASGCERTITFDKDASKYQFFELLK